mgnify:CR=1 FL=1
MSSADDRAAARKPEPAAPGTAAAATAPAAEAGPGAWQTYRRLLGHAGRYWPLLAVAMVGMVVEAVAGAAFVWLMKPLTNDGFVDPKPEMALILPLAIIGLFLLAVSLNDYIDPRSRIARRSADRRGAGVGSRGLCPAGEP